MTASRDWRSTLVRWIFPQPEIARVEVYEPPRAPAGMHPFRRETAEGVRKLFLRVDPSGAGVLVADATEAVRLSQVGCFVVHELLAGVAPKELLEKLPQKEAGAVVDQAVRMIDELGRPDRRYPAMALVDSLEEGDVSHGLEPLQADVEATGDAGGMKRTIDWLVAAGVPHVRFLPAPDVPRDALAPAIEYAEDRGLIAGVRLFAGEAATGDALLRWTDFGLDYVVLPAGLTEAVHRRALGDDDFAALETAIRRTHEREIAAVAEIGLITGESGQAIGEVGSGEDVFSSLEETLERLTALGANYFETFAVVGDAGPDERAGQRISPTELPQLTAFVADLGSRGTAPIAFLPPVYAPSRSIEAILSSGPRTTGDLSLRIDRSGGVYLPRGPRKPVGTTADDWPALRSRPEFERFRHLLATLELGEAAPLSGDGDSRHRDAWADEG